MSEVVQVDAQMSISRVLKPFRTFEAVYQGQSGNIPVAFPGDLDPNAGEEGYDAGLLAGFRVPLGSRVLVMIPQVIEDDTPIVTYSYQFVWRMRNQADVTSDLQAGRKSAGFHIGSDFRGRADGSDMRFFIPGSSDVEVFEQGEPGSGAADLNVKQQRYIPQIDPSWVRPLTPFGSEGSWQQGVYTGGAQDETSGPTYVPLWLDAAGDELMILAYKPGGEGNEWDFSAGGQDAGFGATYGTGGGTLPWNTAVGILIFTGSMSP